MKREHRPELSDLLSYVKAMIGESSTDRSLGDDDVFGKSFSDAFPGVPDLANQAGYIRIDASFNRYVAG